jgi:hypothetical protein
MAKPSTVPLFMKKTISIAISQLLWDYRIRTHRHCVGRVSASLGHTSPVLLLERLVSSPVRHQNATHGKNGEYDKGKKNQPRYELSVRSLVLHLY